MCKRTFDPACAAGTASVPRPHARFTAVVATRGESALERVCSLVLFGDLLSCYLAALGGVDPTAAPPLEELKQLLAADD